VGTNGTGRYGYNKSGGWGTCAPPLPAIGGIEVVLLQWDTADNKCYCNFASPGYPQAAGLKFAVTLGAVGPVEYVWVGDTTYRVVDAAQVAEAVANNGLAVAVNITPMTV
jgi:hypothetical protein